MRSQLVLTAILLIALAIGHFTFVSLVAPVVSSQTAVAQLEDDNGAWQEMQAFEQLKNVVDTSVFAVLLLGAAWIWVPYFKGKKIVKKTTPFILLALCFMLVSTGCRKKFDEPEYKSVKGSQTAIVIPLEGETSAQGTLKSSEYLKKHMVATKRIRIPHRWHSTGRQYWWSHPGKWIPTVRVILVDRAPVPREWTADEGTGTTDNDQAIWVESKDSVGFSIGFTCTAYIEEGDDTATFLYRYPSSDLATIMDKEIRNMIQSEASMACAEYNMDLLRSKKTDIIETIRKVVIPFFGKRGITITTIGMFGGYAYENQKIQDAIDATVVAQQDKVIALAAYGAQQTKNDTIELAAQAVKNRDITIAEGKAGAIEKVAEATATAGKNPTFIKIQELEVEKARIEKWNGTVPQWYFGGGSGAETPSFIIDAPTAGATAN